MTAVYRNPIIDSDQPDLDAIRVGDEFYLVTSSFTRSPGLPIMRSSNLVDWTIVGHAMAELPERARPRPGGGVWAPSLRHRDGLFQVYWADPDDAVFRATATDPAGPWSAPARILAVPGMIDPCPFWDGDGRAWLVHGWAKSRSGIDNRLDILELSADGSEVIGEPRTLIDGDRIDGCRVLEGPKVYYRDGWYWVLAPAGGVSTGWQYAFRSRELLGPYEERVVLEQGSTAVNGPHQGAWVTTPAGEDWFMHFQDRGPFGRVAHLQPMLWDADGWPVIGDHGEPVREHAVPSGLPPSSGAPETVAERWPGGMPGLRWFWQANPSPDWLRPGISGELGLTAVDDPQEDLRRLPHVLARTLPGGGLAAEVELELVGDGPARGGLVVLGASYLWAGIDRTADGRSTLVCARAEQGDPETRLIETPLDATGSDGTDSDGTGPDATGSGGRAVTLRLEVDDSARCRITAAQSGRTVLLADDFAATGETWVGAVWGFFCSSAGSSAEGAFLRIGELRAVEAVRPDGPGPDAR